MRASVRMVATGMVALVALAGACAKKKPATSGGNFTQPAEKFRSGAESQTAARGA